MQGVWDAAEEVDTALVQITKAAASAVIKLQADSARLTEALAVADRERRRAEAAAEVAAARSAAASMAMMDMERGRKNDGKDAVEVVREVRGAFRAALTAPQRQQGKAGARSC